MMRMFVLVLFFCVLTALATASEDCSKLGGKCRPTCNANEAAETGAFEDCPEKDECCVPHSADTVRCCIRSFDAGNFGPANCGLPQNGACAQGSASPVACDKLALCGK